MATANEPIPMVTLIIIGVVISALEDFFCVLYFFNVHGSQFEA